MEQSPSWEADSHSASQEIPRLLWIPNVHCRVHKSPHLFRHSNKNVSINQIVFMDLSIAWCLKTKKLNTWRRKQNRFPKRVVLLSLVCSRTVCMCVHVFFQICCSVLVFWSFCDCDLCVGVSFFATSVFWLQVFMYVCVQVGCSVVCNLALVWFVCGCFVNWPVQVFSFFCL
jgi:hypothetical protein